MTSSGAPETELELDVAEGAEGEDGDQLPLYLRQAKPGPGEGPFLWIQACKASPGATPPAASASPCAGEAPSAGHLASAHAAVHKASCQCLWRVMAPCVVFC